MDGTIYNGNEGIDVDGKRFLVIHLVCRRADHLHPLYIACAPGLTELSAHATRQYPVLRTDATVGVTCPLCRRTREFAEKLAREPKPDGTTSQAGVATRL